jgi:hypothetical protein
MAVFDFSICAIHIGTAETEARAKETAVVTILSLFLLTVPTTMITQLSTGLAPGWQPLLAEFRR